MSNQLIATQAGPAGRPGMESSPYPYPLPEAAARGTTPQRSAACGVGTPPLGEQAAMYGDQKMAKRREKLEMPICARVSASKFRTLEIWCDNSFRKRSEVVGMVLERVLDLLEEHAGIERPVEEFMRRLNADKSQ